MRPKIDDTWFGSITVEGTRYEYDIIIRLSGKVRKRNKALSKAVYGTSHTISLAEIEELYRKKAERLIIGTGQEDQVRLSDEAAKFLASRGCEVDLEIRDEVHSDGHRLVGRSAVVAPVHGRGRVPPDLDGPFPIDWQIVDMGLGRRSRAAVFRRAVGYGEEGV